MTKKTNSTATWVLVIHYDSCDPTVYGPFKSEKECRRRQDEVTAKWTDDDWCTVGFGHGISILKLTA